jgi:beta-galactosidase
VTYDHRHFGRFAAATTHRFGQGQVTYVGTLPDPAFGRTIAGFVLQQAGVHPRWASLPPSARVTGASTRKGRRLWFVSNWAWEPVTVPTPVAGVALLSGRGVREGGSVELGAWDVEIVAEA